MRDRRNLAIALLAAAVAVLGGLLAREWGSREAEPELADPASPDRRPVSAIDVQVDLEGLRQIEILFDRPLGDGKVGEVLGRDPVVIAPRVGGSWSWVAANVLRFDATRRLTPAMRYELTIFPGQLLGGEGADEPGEASALVWTGPRVFEVQTDAFQVERIDVHEEYDPEGEGRIVLRGELRFNYRVEPRELAPRLTLSDPAASEPIAVQLETTYASKTIGWRSDPVEKGAAERELRLTVGADLTSRAGNVPLPADYIRRVRVGSRELLVVRSVAARPELAESSIDITLSSAVDPEVAGSHVSVEPAVAFRLSADRNVLRLRGAFVPGRAYALELGAGLRATDGAALAAPHRQPVRLADLPQSIAFRGEGMFLSAAGDRRIGLDTVNVDRLQLIVERVYRNNVLYLVQQQGHQVFSGRGWGEVSRVFGDRIADVELEIDGARNTLQHTSIALDDYVSGEEPGFYRVTVGRRGSWQKEQRWLLITDLGLVAKRGRGDLLAWVSSFADLSPRAGVRVRVISHQNQPIAEGRTDAGGLLHLRDLGDAFEKHGPAYVIAERGDDWSFLVLDRTRIETAGLDVGGATPPSGGYEAFVYGERDLYRPGEVARGVVVLRDRQLEVPPVMPILLRHTGPDGQQRASRRLELAAGGIAAFEHAIPEIARTGHHTLEAVVADEAVGRWRFQVEEFVPDRISVEVRPPAEAVPGAALAYSVESAYLFGPPAAGLAVETEVRLEAAAFTPQGHPGFSFANPDRKFAARRLLAREGALDAAGHAEFTVELPANLEVPSSLAAVISARVQEQGGRGVAARTRLPIHPYPYYVGLRRVGDGYPEPGATVSFEWVASAPDGSRAHATALRAELFRDEWQTVLRRTPAGTWRYESELDARLVDTRALDAGADGSFAFTPGEYGRYRVVVTDGETGASSRVQFYASGWGFAPWAVENPGRIELDLEREDVAPGSELGVQVRAPFPGRMLLTVEREGVLHSEVHVLDGNTAHLKIPVRASWRPNAYVTATLVRAAGSLEPGAVGRAFGAVSFGVDRARHRMAVSLELPEEVRPRSPLSLVVHAAPRSKVTLAAVDEGVLQLVAQQTPDPFGHFYRKRALGVTSHDTFAFLLPEEAPEGAASTGGGRDAGRAQFVRTEGIRRVKPVAFWSGVIEADGAGTATAVFDVPEFQGALRVMAVAHGGADFGAATRAVRVRDPLVLLPTFPRFLSTGERAEIPITLRNDTGERGRFEVRFAAEGPATVSGPTTQAVELEDGSEQTVAFAVETDGSLGEVTLTIEALGRGESARATRSLGVRPALPPWTLEQVGAIRESATTLAGDGGGRLRPEGLRRELRLAAGPLVQLYGKLRDLLHYPYGCLEQTVSQSFPLIYIAPLARQLEPELFEDRDPDGMVAAGIARIGAMQLPGGGFSLWPRGGSASPWASVYATHFLVEAGRAGHAVEPALGAALGYVAREAVSKPQVSGPELERIVYALYVLARAGEPQRATMDFVRERHRARLRATSRVLLGATYAAAGDAGALEELAGAVADAEDIRRQTGGNFSSTVRQRALLLLALLDAAPADSRIPELAARLGRDGLGRRWNTQESGVALLALGQLQTKADAADYAGVVRVGGRDFARFDTATAVLRDLPPEGALDIQLDEGSSGGPYYSLWVRGTPTDAAFAPESEGLQIERDFLDRDGAPLETTRVAQGDLVVVRIRVRSLEGRVENLVVQNWLPAGFEVENARLATSEHADGAARSTAAGSKWGDGDLRVAHVDVRDDRVLLFAELPDAKWRTGYALLRAVTPGRFQLPPVQAEAMYEPGLRATGARGVFEVERRP